MQYQYVTEKQNYEDFSAGRVILSQSGLTSFPVRLASEIFQRCASYFAPNQQLRLYDSCCGGGYLLTILGFLHHEQISTLYGSDIVLERVHLASDNLNLLTADGLGGREQHLSDLVSQYDKSSHHDALQSVANLRQHLPHEPIPCTIWQADAFHPTLTPQSVDLIICDVPYGDVTAWQSESAQPLADLLSAHYLSLVQGGIVALISDKGQRLRNYGNFTRLQEQTIGKRRFIILQK